MKINFKNRRIWHIALLIFVAHTVYLILKILSTYLSAVQSHESGRSFPTIVAQLALFHYSRALITPLILWFGYLFPIAVRHLWRNSFIHLLLGVSLGTIHTYCYESLLLMLNINFRPIFFTLGELVTDGVTSIVYYVTVVAIQQAYFYFRESQERAFRLQQAELQMLKMQLHPHFFFNTLNAISALMYRSPKEASRMITHLGDIFRVSLRKDKAQEIPLKEELEFIEAFLQIHQTLMGKRLQVEWQVKPETLNALVPNLVLQPLVENAIQHGLAPLEEGGRITIYAARENEKLLLQVNDNGLGLVSENGNNGGIGLTNTRARLENLYNGEHKFSIYEPPNGGVTIKIEIPFREQTAKENEY